MKQLYFVRHGQTEWNAIRRMQGQWNSDLTALGRKQAEVNGKLLSSCSIETMFVSPLDRTRQTAEIINHHLQLIPNYDDRIMEWDCGDWSGEMHEEVSIRWATEWRALQADRFNYRGPNCENYPDMFARAIPFLDEIKTRSEKNIAIVSHGMIGKVMVSQLLELDEKQTVALHQPNDVVFRITLLPSGIEVNHFVKGEGPYPGLRTSTG